MSKITGIGSNTVLTERSLQYHKTVVFDVHLNVVTLNSNGYQTATTKKKMNQAADHFDVPLRVYQRKNEWFVALRGDFDNPIPFEDGMKIDVSQAAFLKTDIEKYNEANFMQIQFSQTQNNSALWMHRLSAPGYLDCTEWTGGFDKEIDAAIDAVQMYIDF